MSALDDRSGPPARPRPPIEVEAKYSIEGEAEFRRVLACAGTLASVREQLNCYLDGPRGDLGRMGWMARIRLTEDEAVLTLKRAVGGWGGKPVAGTRGSPDGVFRAVEIEREVPRALAAAWLAGAGRAPGGGRRRGGKVGWAGQLDRGRTERGLLDPGPEAPHEVRDFLSSGRVALVTWSLTLRWTFRDPGRPDLIADETWFPDGSRDFEVEVECDDVATARARASDVASAAGVALVPQALTKHARAMRRMGGGRGR